MHLHKIAGRAGCVAEEKVTRKSFTTYSQFKPGFYTETILSNFELSGQKIRTYVLIGAGIKGAVSPTYVCKVALCPGTYKVGYVVHGPGLVACACAP